MTTLCIDGWRGVNHSFALVNQCQILELLQLPEVRLFHRDLPFAMKHWAAATHDPGFAPADWAQIAALRAPEPTEAEGVDALLRFSSPFKSPDQDGLHNARGAVPTLTFMVTEMGLAERSFLPGVAHDSAFTRDANCIVTPTRWSRERLVEWGFAADKVQVVTHGVNAQTFHPPSAAERQAQRAALGIRDDEYVFLNLGAAMWNKGLDVLLLAYAVLRQDPRNQHLRLVLKDQRNLYNVGLDGMLRTLCEKHPTLFNSTTLGSISVVSTNLNQAQLAALYGMADCYVSPYRAEGFNLPVLEAIACGTPVVVTGEGATADFCHSGVALSIPSQAAAMNNPAGETGVARYREPSLEGTADAMQRMASGQGLQRDAAFAEASRALVASLSWQRAATELLALSRQASASAPVAEAA